jgi:hypothetical protein
LTKIDGVAATALLAPSVNQLLTSIDFPNMAPFCVNLPSVAGS